MMQLGVNQVCIKRVGEDACTTFTDFERKGNCIQISEYGCEVIKGYLLETHTAYAVHE